MVEFKTAYYGPMEREYHEAITEVPEEHPNKALNKPIVPIYELGQTVVENDPTGRFRNIVQTTQAAIRQGTGTIQLVMNVPHGTPIGGNAKAYGKEVREALRETVLANEVMLAGLEMPTSLNTLAGFDPQSGSFSDEKRTRDLQEIKDAIRFVGDIARGGGVDIVSQEFPRQINALKDPNFHHEGEHAIRYVVDARKGETATFRTTQTQWLSIDKENFQEIKAKPGEQAQLQQFDWHDFERWAEHIKQNPRQGREEADKAITPEELFIQVQLDSQIQSTRGYAARSYEFANQRLAQIENAKKELATAERRQDEQRIESIKRLIHNQERLYEDEYKAAIGSEQQARELEERRNSYKSMTNYASKRSYDGYAQAGIAAMQETNVGLARGTLKKPLYVGPELGWPTSFGGHPDEFIEIVQNSRKRMAEVLTNPYKTNPDGTPMLSADQRPQQNPYYQAGLNKEQALEHAKKHIKGLFDTSHMGMWLSHFKPEAGENEDQRIQRFNKWFLKQTEKIAKADVVGGVQLVDSMSGAHGHLPAGQGIFPVKQAAEILKQHGYTGFMVSEGHEEEKFGEGRILGKTWQEFGSPLGNGYFGGPSQQWNRASNAYFGRTYSPTFIFGSYAPSNEFKLWSDVPLE